MKNWKTWVQFTCTWNLNNKTCSENFESFWKFFLPHFLISLFVFHVVFVWKCAASPSEWNMKSTSQFSQDVCQFKLFNFFVNCLFRIESRMRKCENAISVFRCFSFSYFQHFSDSFSNSKLNFYTIHFRVRAVKISI